MFQANHEFKCANIPRTIRFTNTLFRQLNSQAIQNDTSFNSLVLQCCKYALENDIAHKEK